MKIKWIEITFDINSIESKLNWTFNTSKDRFTTKNFVQLVWKDIDDVKYLSQQIVKYFSELATKEKLNNIQMLNINWQIAYCVDNGDSVWLIANSDINDKSLWN